MNELEKGITYYEQGDFTLALRAFSEYAAEQGYDAEILNYLGRCETELGNDDEAIAYFDRALLLAPTWERLFFNKALVYMNMGEYDEAEALYKRSIMINSNSEDAWYYMGLFYEEMGNFFEAKQCYLISLEIDPLQEETHIHLGNVYFEMGEEHYVDALREENLALEINPHSKLALFNKALMLKKLQQFKPSEQLFIDLCLTDVKDREVHVHLADLYLIQGEFQKAEQYIRRVLELNPADATGLSLLSEMYEQAGKIEKAIETLLRLLEVEPDNIEIYTDMADLYKKINNLAKVEECIAHIQRLNSLD